MKIIHTMIRVLDLDRSLNFYRNVLGMAETHRLDFPDFALVYLREPVSGQEIELTLNKGRAEAYTHGTGYGHVAVCVDNLDAEHSRVKALGGAVDDHHGWGSLQLMLFEAVAEKHLIQPTFVTEYPEEVSPLARRADRDAELVDRFELFVDAKEMANGFSELNDPEDQAQRFLAQAKKKEAGDQEAMFYDADYIRALEYGLPPTAGAGVGVDRLVMILTDSPSIRDVILFPQMRPET